MSFLNDFAYEYGHVIRWKIEVVYKRYYNLGRSVIDSDVRANENLWYVLALGQLKHNSKCLESGTSSLGSPTKLPKNYSILKVVHI